MLNARHLIFNIKKLGGNFQHVMKVSWQLMRVRMKQKVVELRIISFVLIPPSSNNLEARQVHMLQMMCVWYLLLVPVNCPLWA